MKTIHPAIAEHVMEENEKLREVLRCIADLPMDRCSTENDYRLSAAKAIALGALSQQPEPTDTYTAVDMATAAAQGFRDGQAAVEQAAAQDELAIDTAPLLHFIFSEYSSPEMAGRLPDDVVRVVRALEAGARPAQTEQQAELERNAKRWQKCKTMPKAWWLEAMAEAARKGGRSLDESIDAAMAAKEWMQ